jgi:mRNA interferase MazF
MTDYSYGDIVLVPFPFTDQSTTKKRPALIVSSDSYNRQRPDIIIMAVTSQMRSISYFGDVSIEDWKQAGLLKPSVIKPIFTTIEKGLVIKKLGRIGSKDHSSLKAALKTILGN